MGRKLLYNEEEGGMAKAQLQKIEMYAAKLNDMIHPDDELEGWVQNKLSVVAAYMGDVKHYLDYALQNEPEYKEFANGGMTDKPRYWEVEFTWDAAEDESRKVNVMAESVSDAEEQVKKKFGPYYEGLKVVEVEEDKEITWEEYSKRPKDSYALEVERVRKKYGDVPPKIIDNDYDKYEDGGMVYDIEWKDEEGDTYEASFQSLEEAKQEIRKIRDDGGRIIQTWKYRDGEYVGRFDKGGETDDEKYFIYKTDEHYLEELKEGEIDSEDLETLLNNLFVDVHKKFKSPEYVEREFIEITPSDKKLIVDTAMRLGIAEMVDGQIDFVEKEKDYSDDDEYADGGVLDDLKNQGVKKEFIRQAFFAGGNNGSKAASGKDYDTYEQWLKKHKIKHHIIYKKAFEDGGKAGFNLMKGKDAETFEEWQKKIEKEWSGKMASGGTMRYEGSTEAEDFKEAEEYIGKDVWETLSKDDKLNATNYLKAKGLIGYFGQEEELADFMASQYGKGGSLYRGYRPSPSISATAYPRGFKMIGNDGNMWEISLDSRGVHRWTKSTSATRNDRMEQKAKIREAIELLESMRDDIDVDDEIATLKKLQ